MSALLMKFLGPLLRPILQRLFLSWKTSVVGTATGAAIYEYLVHALAAAGCNLDIAGTAALIAGLGAAVPGLIGTDNGVKAEKVSAVLTPDDSITHS